MDKKVKVGIIGTGMMAKHHAENFLKIDGIAIPACFDADPERAKAFAETHSIPNVAESFDDLLAEVDAISIVTPDRFHGALTIQALAADKHVLCEKPLTLTLTEANEVAAEARKASERGVIHMVNFSYRGSAAFQEAIRLASDGAIGEIRHVHSFYLQQWLASTISSETATPERLWRLSTSLGSQGVLGDLGCHILDLTTACSGDLQSLRCDLRTFPKRVDGEMATSVIGIPLDANDTAIVEFELVGGGVGICHTTRVATGHGNHIRFEAHGTDGAMRFDLDKDPLEIDIWRGDARSGKEWTTVKLDPTPNNWERFISSIRSGVQDQPDILRGARVQAYLDACERSAASGLWESI